LSLWLGEAAAEVVAEAMAAADALVVSDLTQVECRRAFLRQSLDRRKRRQEFAQWTARAEAVWAAASVLHFTPTVCARAGEIVPELPVRTLDALHLAFFERAELALGDVALLSLDQRLRQAAQGLGYAVAPEV
jgi:predicted nucleic acid-binding protein